MARQGFDPDAMGKLVGEFVLKAIEKRVAPLEARLDAMVQKGITYRGVYQHSDEYKRGDLVSYHGSIFHAIRDVRGEYPHRQDDSGQARTSDAWVLAVRRGRDAR